MARIRTVKPEYWTHPVMARQLPETRLVALALLNLADDEGYFFADPRIIRNFAFPFDDDSSNVRRSLDDLSRIGYIEVRESVSEHGETGKIVSFSEHQKIDRPKLSSIRELFDKSKVKKEIKFDDDSTMIRRTLDDDSTGKGRKGRKEGTNNNTEIEKKETASRCVAVAPLNEKVPDPFYKAIWESFISKAGTFTNYPKESQATKRLIGYFKDRENPEQTAESVLTKFYELTKSGNQFWGSQPFTPSTLSSPGIFDRVLVELDKSSGLSDTEWMNDMMEGKIAGPGVFK